MDGITSPVRACPRKRKFSRIKTISTTAAVLAVSAASLLLLGDPTMASATPLATPAVKPGVSTIAPQAHGRRIPNIPADLSPHIWYNIWTVPPHCSDGTCTTGSTDDIPRYYIHGNGFSPSGLVNVGVYNISDGSAIWARTVRASISGYFDMKADVFQCPVDSEHPVNSYIQARDSSSGLFSGRMLIRTGCSFL